MTIADSDEFRVTANPALLSLAVDNLVRNAVVHNVDGGSVTIETGNDGDGTLHLVIENTTDGTIPDDLGELVQPFHRGTDSRISAADGVGLGLSIADAACNAMGAELRLSRTDDGGFRATIVGLHTV
ncbi:sensor histidine kinase [Bifidobacterium platyrrhinorum]|uniref:sensor histidine kinase n=1 Tax=Bifidobacterium platyrrhinorum TaxID=2661628 RepID=UPI0013D82D61|nr:ATP-binding protein [Bifidobacterium platyrrhinorum]